MRRLALLGVLSSLVVMIAAPAAVEAVPAAPGDGSLAIKGATGVVSVAVRGALIGQLDRGTVWIDDTTPAEGRPPVVWGFEARRPVTGTKLLYSGTDIRFRVIGGFFRLRVSGSGVDLSVVGRGSATLGPSPGFLVGGTYSVDGAPALPFPEIVTPVQLGPAAPPGS